MSLPCVNKVILSYPCKSKQNQELLASLEQQEADSSELIERNTSCPNEGAPANIPDDSIPAPPEQSVECVGQVRDAIYDLGSPDGISINAINPDSPTKETRAMLNAKYARWLPPLAGPNRQRPSSQQPGAPRGQTG